MENMTDGMLPSEIVDRPDASLQVNDWSGIRPLSMAALGHH